MSANTAIKGSRECLERVEESRRRSACLGLSQGHSLFSQLVCKAAGERRLPEITKLRRDDTGETYYYLY